MSMQNTTPAREAEPTATGAMRRPAGAPSVREAITDCTALAIEIAIFETEFPALEWTITKSGSGMALGEFNMEAASVGRSPAHGIRLLTAELTDRKRRRATARAHDAALTAEYGPEVVA